MESSPLSVLIVEDEPAHAEAMRRALGAAEPDAVRVARSLQEARREIARKPPAIVVADLNLADGKALDLLAGPMNAQPFPVLVMTSYGDEQTAVQAMKAGAIDYVVKSPQAFAELPHTLARALREWRLVEDRKQAENALRHALQFSQQIISGAAEGIVVLDDHLRIVVWNRYMEELAGISSGDVVGKEIVAVFCHLRKRGVEPLLAQALAGERVATGDIEFEDTRTGLPTWYVATFAPHRDADGRIVGVIASVRDITERRRASEERLEMERRLLHAQRLESLGVLAGGIAHDFNNLLAAILGNAGLALDCLEPESRGHRFVGRIEKAALRAADLTNQMLAYSGRGAFHIEPLDICALVCEMGDLLRTVVPRQIGLRLECPGGLPTVKGDAAQIRQVVMNLITNAADALGETRGEVRIRTYVEQGGSPAAGSTYPGDGDLRGACVVLEVADTGCGMDAETQARLFDPFFTTKFAGRGLGMAAVLGIVRGHEGAIRVDSRPGEGTVVRVYLPANGVLTGLPEAPPAPSGTPPPDETATILVADDEPDVRTVARITLEFAGFRVLLAEDGQEAVDLFRANAGGIAAVLLDLTMPRKGGAEVLAELREIEPGLPVILSSGYTETDIRGRLGTADASFIQKPYRTQALVDLVKQVLHGRAR